VTFEQQDPDGQVPASEPEKRLPRRVPEPLQRIPAAVAVVVTALALGALGGYAIGAGGSPAATAKAGPSPSATGPHAFSDAITKCNLVSTSEGASISDNGHTMTVENKGKEDSYGLDQAKMWCLVKAVGAPQAAVSHMEQTTSLDGRQTESWGNITVSWSFHPDRGMDSVFTEK
jgi:hypothetical protein